MRHRQWLARKKRPSCGCCRQCTAADVSLSNRVQHAGLTVHVDFLATAVSPLRR